MKNLDIEMILSIAPHINPQIAESYLIDLEDYLRSSIIAKKPGITDRLLEQEVVKESKWHIKRVAGFGGSDMAVLYTEYMDEFHPFSTADGIVAQKLCLSLPDEQTGDMERGTLLEPIIREKFIDLFSDRELEPDLEAWDALKKNMDNGGLEKYPWMRSSPDDIFIDNEGKRVLVDYKSPASEDTVLDLIQEVPGYYKAQLGQYRMHLKELGIHIDETYLAPLSLKNMSVHPLDIPQSKEIEKVIAEAGDYYWDHVLRNELPKRPPNREFESISDVPEVMQIVISDFILSKKISNNSANQAEKLKKKLLDMSHRFGVEYEVVDKKTRLPGIDLSHKLKRTLDNKAVQQAFVDLGGDLNDPDLYKESPGTTVSVIRSKKTIHQSMIQDIEEVALQSISDARSEMGIEHIDNSSSLEP